MGNKVENHAQIREMGRFGFVVGRGRGPQGPSLERAPDGSPWTFHDSSPMVDGETWRLILNAARQATSAGRWVQAVGEIDPAMAEWLAGLREPDRMWVEARG